MLSRPGRWLVLLRAVLVVVGAIAVALTDFPPSYEPWAWAVVGFFAAVTVFSGVLAAVELDPTTRVRARVLMLALDAAGETSEAILAYWPWLTVADLEACRAVDRELGRRLRPGFPGP